MADGRVVVRAVSMLVWWGWWWGEGGGWGVREVRVVWAPAACRFQAFFCLLPLFITLKTSSSPTGRTWL